MSRGPSIQAGTLLPAIRKAAESARQSGALQPLRTIIHQVEDRGVVFQVRQIDSLQRKPRPPGPEPSASRASDVRRAVSDADHSQASDARQTFNPFLPYDPQLFVANLSPDHVGLLNKYPVIENHLLVVSRTFVEQQAELELDDFRVMLRCLEEFQGLVFYNSGKLAGASQRHKHLQVVPLPLNDLESPRFPLEPWFLSRANLGGGEDMRPDAGDGLVHFVAKWSQPATETATAGEILPSSAESAHAIYRRGLQELGLLQSGRGSLYTAAYNLLLTRDLLVLIPRRRESVRGCSLNALAFAGCLLAPTADGVREIRQAGPWRMLIEAAGYVEGEGP